MSCFAGSDGSVNVTNSSAVSTTTTLQNNLAKIVTELNLSANTGQNIASQNTGGNSNIQTGDATIIATIVNFVNNNISGDSRLVVTVINVFGQWFGDFVPTGEKKSEKTTSNTVTQLPSDQVTQLPSNPVTKTETVTQTAPVVDPVVTNKISNVKPIVKKSYVPNVPTVLAGTSFNDALMSKGNSKPNNVIKINLAWLLLIIPMVFLGRLIIWHRR